MATAASLRCDGCGAPLPAPGGRTALTCTYCHRELLVHAESTTVSADAGARGLTDRLLQGHTGHDVGTGERYLPGQRQWIDPAHNLWPIAARASSSYGGGWSAEALLGPPRVFPRHGDIAGAWAPKTRQSSVEWVEVDFPSHGPPSHTLRVFETNLPGATFAVTLVRDGSEELLWQRAPKHIGGGARILEIALPYAQPVDRVRVYVSNTIGSSWSEIDTVALVTSEPVPMELRQQPVPRSRRGLVGWVIAMMVIFSAGAAIMLRGPDVTPTLEHPADTLEGAAMMSWTIDRAGLDAQGVAWATEVRGFSSQYGESRNAARHALGPPDVFPAYGDLAHAWAPREQDRGLEHIELRFGAPVTARAVVIVETLHPGALARVEDVSRGRAPAVLWEGATTSPSSSRVLSLDLPAPRAIDAVRLVLDTRRASGWNEIDAVGLLPAR